MATTGETPPRRSRRRSTSSGETDQAEKIQENTEKADAFVQQAQAVPREPFEPQPAMFYQRMAVIMVIGMFVVMLACICACTLIPLVFLWNPPW
jgi:hypothetical protein